MKKKLKELKVCIIKRSKIQKKMCLNIKENVKKEKFNWKEKELNFKKECWKSSLSFNLRK